ncbi:hypothetical protein BKA56DRAFT_331959 [Ilyonectria sp. MPI-CAGE-AT-0026]|nr:hypothetical protein BKA56DRAFT_331959 [Ilyonectria sp. MPI-CAGE-AT-0026]
MMTLDPCLECHSVPANDVCVDHEQFEVSCQNPSPLRPIRQTSHASGSKPRPPVLPRWSGRRVCPLDNRCDWLAYEAEVQYIHARGEYVVASFCTCLSNCHGGPSATGARSVPHLSPPGEALSGSRMAGLTGGAGARTECRQGTWLIRLGSPVCPGRAINVGRLVVVGETMNPTKRHASGLTTAVDLIIKVASGSCAMQFATTPELLAAIHVEHTYSPCRGHTRPEMYAGG